MDICSEGGHADAERKRGKKNKKGEGKERMEPAATTESRTRLIRLQTLYDEIKSKHNSIIDTEDIYNTELKERIKDYKHGYNKDDSQNNERLYKNCLASLYRSILLVPFSYDDKTKLSAKEIHLSSASAEKINESSIVYRVERMTPDQISKLMWVLDEQNMPTFDFSWWDVSRFAGSEGCSFATEGSENQRVMVPYTFNTADGGLVIPGYTGIDTLTRAMNSLGINDGYGIMAYTWADYVHSFQRITDLAALIVDMGCPETHCYISSSVFCKTTTDK